MRSLLIPFFTYALISCVLSLRDQSVAIKGSLKCHMNLLVNKTVELYEKRTAPLRDQKLASNTTDSQGRFYLSGSANRLLPITPILRIPSDCSNKEVKIKLNIVKTAVSKGKIPKTVADIGVVNLDSVSRPPSPTSDNIPFIDVEEK